MRETLTALGMAITATILSAAPAMAREPIRLAPNSSWNLDAGEDRCALARSFANGEDRLDLRLARYSLDPMSDIMLVGDLARLSKPQLAQGADRIWQHVTFDFQPTGLEAGFTPRTGKSDQGPVVYSRYLSIDLDKFKKTGFASASQAMAASTSIAIDGLRQEVVLDTGSLKPALGAMENCLDVMVSHWGLDPAAIRSQQSSPRLTEDSYDDVYHRIVRDYPLSGIASMRDAVVTIRLIIDEKGEMTGCKLVESTYAKHFAEGVCEMIGEYGRFEPAIGADGKPIASYMIQLIDYHIIARGNN